MSDTDAEHRKAGEPEEPEQPGESGTDDDLGEVEEPAALLGRLSRRRIVLGAVAIVVLIAVAISYVVYTNSQDTTASGPSQAVGPLSLTPGATPTLLFRSEQPGPDLGRVATVPVNGTTGPSPAPRTIGSVSCDRVYEAAGTVLCLRADRGMTTTNYAYIYDRSWKEITHEEIAGVPNRARISADGHIASWTVFVTGDSYAAANFSTRTSILDIRTNTFYPSLENFTVHKDGQVYRSADINFWGVTVTSDDDTFYATMGTGGQTYLVRGSISRKEVTTVRSNVECPSLSPDNTRIVYKKKVSDDIRHPWHLYVLNLATMQDTPLAESNSVDDQAAWLDDHTVMYSLPSSTDPTGDDIWEVPADGSGSPKLLVHDGFSPAVVS